MDHMTLFLPAFANSCAGRVSRARRWIDGTLELVFAAFALRLATDRS